MTDEAGVEAELEFHVQANAATSGGRKWLRVQENPSGTWGERNGVRTCLNASTEGLPDDL